MCEVEHLRRACKPAINSVGTQAPHSPRALAREELRLRNSIYFPLGRWKSKSVIQPQIQYFLCQGNDQRGVLETESSISGLTSRPRAHKTIRHTGLINMVQSPAGLLVVRKACGSVSRRGPGALQGQEGPPSYSLAVGADPLPHPSSASSAPALLPHTSA